MPTPWPCAASIALELEVVESLDELALLSGLEPGALDTRLGRETPLPALPAKTSLVHHHAAADFKVMHLGTYFNHLTRHFMTEHHTADSEPLFLATFCRRMPW